MRDYFRQNSIDEDDILLDSDAVTAWLKATAETRDTRPEPGTDSREEILARLGRV